MEIIFKNIKNYTPNVNVFPLKLKVLNCFRIIFWVYILLLKINFNLNEIDYLLNAFYV